MQLIENQKILNKTFKIWLCLLFLYQPNASKSLKALGSEYHLHEQNIFDSILEVWLFAMITGQSARLWKWMLFPPVVLHPLQTWAITNKLPWLNDNDYSIKHGNNLNWWARPSNHSAPCSPLIRPVVRWHREEGPFHSWRGVGGGHDGRLRGGYSWSQIVWLLLSLQCYAAIDVSGWISGSISPPCSYVATNTSPIITLSLIFNLFFSSMWCFQNSSLQPLYPTNNGAPVPQSPVSSSPPVAADPHNWHLIHNPATITFSQGSRPTQEQLHMNEWPASLQCDTHN